MGLAPKLPAPTTIELEQAFGRTAAAGLCYALAALVLQRTGHSSDKGPYLAMAVAMLPQIVMFALASGDPKQRRALRLSRWPMPLHAGIAIVLGATAVTALTMRGLSFIPGWAAAVAAAAACLAAYPPVVWFPAKR